jgi:dinuclear metal center YbgI/SA1388 family protein
MHVRELIDHIERLADPRLAAGWDKSGLQIAGTVEDCRRLAVTLDPLPHIVEQALAWGAACILSHHPLSLSPGLPNRLDDYHRVLGLVLGRGAWLYAAHTSLDVRTDGPAGWLADALDLRGRRILEPAGRRPHIQTRLRLPSPGDRDRVLNLLSGRDRCQVLALTDSLVEVIHPEPAWPDLEVALTAACPGLAVVSSLPLAEPADVYGYGLVGDLPEPLPFARLCARLGELLPRAFFSLAGEVPEVVTRLAYCPGSGADMAPLAFAAGAEAYVTGDLKYHQALSVPRGRLVMDVGHFSLEEVMMRVFARDLTASLGETAPEIRFFPGTDPFSLHFPDGALPSRTK